MRVACLEKMRQQIILTVNPQSMKYIILALELNTCTHYISDPLSMEEHSGAAARAARRGSATAPVAPSSKHAATVATVPDALVADSAPG